MMKLSAMLGSVVLLVIALWLEGLHAAIVDVTLVNNKDAQVTFSSRACAPGTCPPVGTSNIVLIGTIEIDSIGLFTFDLSSIPSDATIVSAEFQLPTGFSLGSPTGGITLSVSQLGDTSFNEATVDSSSVPPILTPALGTVSFVDPGPSSVLDVTSQTAAAFLSPSQSIGFSARSTFANVFLNSREAGAGAKLIIKYDDNIVVGPPSCPVGSCPSDLSCCMQASGPSCYDSNIYTCDGNLLCPIGQLACGDACYRPSMYQCFDNKYLCPTNYLSCGVACYRSELYTCCSGDRLVPKGESC